MSSVGRFRQSIKMFVVISLFLALVPGVPLQADSEKPHKFDFSLKDADASTAIKKLAEISGESLIVDGYSQIKVKELNVSGTFLQVLEKVASEFDYSFRLSKSGSVLLTKRFVKKETRSQAHLAELQATAEDILHTIKEVYRPSDETNNIEEIFQKIVTSLSPDQTRALRMGQHLPVATLNEAQVSLISDAINIEALRHPLLCWQDMYEQLNSVQKSHLRYSLVHFDKISAFDPVDHLSLEWVLELARPKYRLYSVYSEKVTKSNKKEQK